jgi:hypothetical protein
MHRILSGLLLLVATTGLLAFSEGRLLSQSTSGHTVLFNLGTHDNIKEGEYAVIVKQIRALETKDLRLVLAARARNIKVSTDHSIWIIYHVYDGELLVKGRPYLVFSESNVMQGRKDPTIGRSSVVGAKGKAVQTAKDALSDDKDRISKLKNDYPIAEHVHGKELRSDKDFELLDIEEWEKTGNRRYQTALYRSPHKEEFRKAYRLDLFHKMVAAYAIKVNDPNFNYENFYEYQMRDGASGMFRKGNSVPNEFEQFLYLESKRSSEDARLYRSILEKGESWSQDFSDEELRKVLTSVSSLQEKDRRVMVASKPVRYSMNLDYGVPLNDEQTDADSAYRREKTFAMAADFEVTPFLKHPTLERFTFNFMARVNKSGFAERGSNLNLDEMSVGAGGNWYPLHSPYVAEAPLLFLGAYIRSGKASLDSPISNQSGKYDLSSAPGLRAGMKYLFKNKLGLRIVGSMETLKLDRTSTNTLGSSLPEQASVTEAKLNFGIAYSF